MRGGDDVMVEERLRALAERLHGPRRLKADLLTEARHGLLDAVEAYRDAGLAPTEAHRRAVVEFGTPAELAGAYQAELTVGALRGLSLRVLAVAVTLSVAGDLTWRGSSWSDGPPPPMGYRLLSTSIDWIWLAAAVLAIAGMLLTGRRATPGGQVLERTVGRAGRGTRRRGGGRDDSDRVVTRVVGRRADWPRVIGMVVPAPATLARRAAHCWFRAVRTPSGSRRPATEGTQADWSTLARRRGTDPRGANSRQPERSRPVPDDLVGELVGPPLAAVTVPPCWPHARPVRAGATRDRWCRWQSSWPSLPTRSAR